MLLWFLIGTGVITISAVALIATVYLTVTGWIHRQLGGKDG